MAHGEVDLSLTPEQLIGEWKPKNPKFTWGGRWRFSGGTECLTYSQKRSKILAEHVGQPITVRVTGTGTEEDGYFIRELPGLEDDQDRGGGFGSTGSSPSPPQGASAPAPFSLADVLDGVREVVREELVGAGGSGEMPRPEVGGDSAEESVTPALANNPASCSHQNTGAPPNPHLASRGWVLCTDCLTALPPTGDAA